MALDMQQWQQLQELSFDNLGSWPRGVLLAFSALVCALASVGLYLLLISDITAAWRQAVAGEQQLHTAYQSKIQLSQRMSHFQQHQQQMEQQLVQLLDRLPDKDETAMLLDELTYHGISSGLTIRRINWQPEISHDVYVELPIRIEVTGGYHSLGEFVTRIAMLPRIITLHDFSITARQSDQLTVSLKASTYRFTGQPAEVGQ